LYAILANVAAGFFLCGWSTGRRMVAIDPAGCVRSTRQGAITLSRANVAVHRPGWQVVAAPQLRVFVAVVPPQVHLRAGQRRNATRAWRTRAWHAGWAALNPARRVAAMQALDDDTWATLLRAGTTPLPEIVRDRRPHTPPRRSASSTGAQLQRDAAPLWVPEGVQDAIVFAATEEEVTAHRTYRPAQLVQALRP
jgi:hypothetical protein